MGFRWLILPLLISCGGPSAPPSREGVVGPAGGQVAAGDNAAVIIPQGALAADTTITLKPTQATAPDDTTIVDTPYVFGPEGTQFAIPATVMLEVVADLMPADALPSDVVIYTAPANTTLYTELPTVVVDDTHVSAETSHFSIFVAAVKHKHNHDPDAGVSADAPVSADAGVDAMPDAMTSACSPTKSGSIQVCTWSASCNGHTYAAQCAGSACTCTVGPNGQPQQVSATNPCGATSQAAWTACGFP